MTTSKSHNLVIIALRRDTQVFQSSRSIEGSGEFKPQDTHHGPHEMGKRSLGTILTNIKIQMYRRAPRRCVVVGNRCRKPKNRHAGATQVKYPSHAKDVQSHDSIELRTGDCSTDFHVDR